MGGVSFVCGRWEHDGMSPTVLLEFERRWPRHTAEKDSRIRAELGITPARYYQLLTRAAKTRDGIESDPITARRVRERVARNVA